MDWINQIPVLRDFIFPLLDIVVLAFLFYQIYQILVQTRAVQLIRGIAAIFVLYGIALAFNLHALITVLTFISPGVIIALSIIFQPELRKIFTRIGQGRLFKLRGQQTKSSFTEILKAAREMSLLRRGALIVFVRSVGLKNLAETGTIIDAEISSILLETIFKFDTPLHDGAVIIEQGRILAGGVVLPLSENSEIKKSFGTRHRAALGVSEDTDAVALVVSEETGSISLAVDGILFYNLRIDEIIARLGYLLQSQDEAHALIKSLEGKE